MNALTEKILIGGVALNLFLSIGLGGFCLHLSSESKALEQKLGAIDILDAAVKEVDTKLEAYKGLATLGLAQVLKGAVDLTSSSLQELGNGFLVTRLEVEQHLTGVKVSGMIVNTQAIQHESASFEISIGESKNEFRVMKLRQGAAGRFSVYVPEVKPEDTKNAFINYKNSTIKFRI